MNTNKLAEKITVLAEENLPSPQYFIVDVRMSSAVRPTIKILVDGDSGISIDTCAELSRELNSHLESIPELAEGYVLEVSSPGVDYPLSSKRQYEKNIGRNLRVITADGVKNEGKLLSVSGDNLNLEIRDKKNVEHKTIALEAIKKSTVLVSFK